MSDEADRLAGLDAPVRRYLAHAMPDGPLRVPGVRIAMAGRIRAGAWLPFRADQESDGRSFAWRATVGPRRIPLLSVTDRFARGTGSTHGRLLGRLPLLRAAGSDIDRSAAGRAALESVFAPASLLPGDGVTWRAERDDLIVATVDVPPERPEVFLRIDTVGAVRASWAQRWGQVARKQFDYIPCGCEVHAERRFGPLVVPSRVTVGWWFGTSRYRPFFRAEILTLGPQESSNTSASGGSSADGA